MDGFDAPAVYYNNCFGEENADLDVPSSKVTFKNFLKTFTTNNFNYKYRDALKQNYNLKKYYVEVNIEDLAAFDSKLAQKLKKQPTEYLPLFEESAKEVADEVTSPRPESEEEVEDIQVMLTSDCIPVPMRSLKSDMVSQIVKIPGIVIQAAGIKSKATNITLQCKSCGKTIPKIPIRPGLEGLALPRHCTAVGVGPNKCPLDPYQIRTESCTCVDFQVCICAHFIVDLIEHIICYSKYSSNLAAFLRWNTELPFK